MDSKIERITITENKNLKPSESENYDEVGEHCSYDTREIR